MELNQDSSTQPGPAQTSSLSHGGRLFSALAWTSGAKWSAQLLSWATTVIVARLLTPNDYGLVGMATLVMGVAALVADLGVGTAVVTQRVTDVGALRQLNVVAYLAGLGSFLLVVVASPSLARFFRAEPLVPIVAVLGATLAIGGMKTVAEGILVQERRFRLLAGVEGAKAVLAALVTLAGALLGWGYWSLVAGHVAGAVFGTGAFLLLRPIPFAKPKRDVVGPLIGVSFDILGSRLAWYSYSNADFLIAGRVLGAGPLGIYTIAWTIATAPVDKIAAILNLVSAPFFAASRDDRAALRSQFLTLTEGIALITIPACLGLALVADDLVGALLGPRWSGAVLPLRVLCLYTPLRCAAVVLPPLLLVLGESRYLLICTAAAAVGLPFCFLGGSKLGPVGIAAAWALAYPLVAMPLYTRSLPRIQVSGFDYVRSLRVPISAGVGMVLVVASVGQVLPAQWNLVSRLVIQVGVGVAAWAVALAVISLPTARRLIELCRQLVRASPTTPR